MARQPPLHFQLRGGLDIVSSPLTVEPGRLWAALNYIPVEAGYQRVRGFERYSGLPSPSDAAYWLLGYELDTDESAAEVDDELEGGTSGATGRVLKVIEDADDDTKGEYVIGRVSGTFQDDETLLLVEHLLSARTFTRVATKGALGTGSSVFEVYASGTEIDLYIGSDETTRPDDLDDLFSAGDVVRIEKDADNYIEGTVSSVVGAGARLNFTLSAAITTEGAVGNTDSGLTFERRTELHSTVGTARQYGASSVDNDLDFRDLAAEDRRADIEKVPGSGPVRGAHWYKGELYAVRDEDADSPKTAGLYRATSSGWTAVTGVTLSPGGTYRFINYNFQGQAATLKMYGVNGKDKAFHLHKSDATPPVFTFTSITTGASPDTPTHVAVQSNHLVLAVGGSLIISATGDPDDYMAANGAAEIATGQDINGILGGLGVSNTLIMGDDHMAVLYGEDSENFVLGDMSQEQTGGVEGTLQSVGGPLYMDNRGVRSVTTTEAYGNFVIGTMTADVQPWLDRQRDERNLPAGSLRIRSADQYRVFFESGLGLCIYLGRGRPEMSFIDYGKSIECSTSAEDDDRIERVFFGSDDGFVYEAERGRSFDGEPIAAYIRLPLNHAGTPTREKKWIRADVHLDVQSQISLELSALYDDGANPDQLIETKTVRGGGTLFEEGLYEAGYYDSPLNSYITYDLQGIGRNVSLLLRTESDREPIHTCNGISLHFSIRRTRR